MREGPCACCPVCRSPIHRLLHLLVPPLRGYLRYAPWKAGKRALWTRFVGPYLSGHNHAFTARTVYGGRVSGDQRTVMPRCIYYFGLWEPALTRWIHDTLAPGDGFVDVGANIGYFSVVAGEKIGPEGSVVAIDPSHSVVSKLRANIALNRLTNVRVVRAAASAAEQRVAFYQAPWNDAESSTAPLSGLEKAADVPAMPLAELLTPAELRSCRVIKIDVEGAEVDVVAGLMPALDRLRPDAEIVIEVHPHLLAQQEKSVSDIVDLLAPAGFAPYWLPVDFSPLAHLEAPATVVPLPLDEPGDEVVHVIFLRSESR